MSTGAWGTEAVERAPIKEIPLINEVHIDGLVSIELPVEGHWAQKEGTDCTVTPSCLLYWYPLLSACIP